MACPLCAHEHCRPSWLGSTFYDGEEFSYAECLSCGSLYCDPMPDAKTLARIYGPDYGASFASDPIADNSKKPEQIVRLLSELKKGVFLDYGCGGGSLLIEAANLGWRSVGVEFDEDVASAVEKQTGAKVITAGQAGSLNGTCADVLHLGDVIEHLTDLGRQMPEILRLIKPGGLLVAQGPLEANRNLFTLMLRLYRRLGPVRRTEMPPYHVLLATAKGQRLLFERLGLKERRFIVEEVCWPAPSRLSLSTVRQPRLLALFSIRRISQAVSAIARSQMGNRYFYVGEWNG